MKTPGGKKLFSMPNVMPLFFTSTILKNGKTRTTMPGCIRLNTNCLDN
jgi:hypothetical protein